MKIENNNQEVENHTLEDLKQKLINDMYELVTYEKEDIEILKILFEIKKHYDTKVITFSRIRLKKEG